MNDEGQLCGDRQLLEIDQEVRKVEKERLLTRFKEKGWLHTNLAKSARGTLSLQGLERYYPASNQHNEELYWKPNVHPFTGNHYHTPKRDLAHKAKLQEFLGGQNQLENKRKAINACAKPWRRFEPLYRSRSALSVHFDSRTLGSISLAKIMQELKAQPNFKKTRPEVHRSPELFRKSENLKDNFV